MNDELHLTNEALQERHEEVNRLNRFMSLVLSSMSPAVAVVDQDLQVTAWNAKAEDLWGLRSQEALGSHLLGLDIGLPLDEIRPILRRQLSEVPQPSDGVRLAAVNRRGKPVHVEVTVTNLSDGADGPQGAVLIMDVLPDGDG